MFRPRSSLKVALAALALGPVAAFVAAAQAQEPAGQSLPDLALMGTIPIYWGEAASLAELLAPENPEETGGPGEHGEGEHGEAGYGEAGHAGPHPLHHWARERLEERFRLIPVDYLSGEVLAGHERLLLAQPRALSPEENVALDRWVRQGGRLLLFADPWMTGESRFGIGDRRRPQDVALLSPILEHWGLRLEFVEAQAPGIAQRDIAGGEIAGSDTPTARMPVNLPVNLPGRFAALESASPEDRALDHRPDRARCRLAGEAVLALCRLGEGRIVVLADAALLDIAGPWPGAPEALALLTQIAFDAGFNAGLSTDAEGSSATLGEITGVNAPTPASRGEDNGNQPFSSPSPEAMIAGQPPG